MPDTAVALAGNRSRPIAQVAEREVFPVQPYAKLLRDGMLTTVENSHSVTLSRSLLVALLRPILSDVKFDPAFYRRHHPDIAQAEAAGIITSLHDHYLEFGYFENRLPCHIEVDGTFYGKEYPDVAAKILDGSVKSAQWHFEWFGFKEGRLPRRGWSFSDLLTGN